MRSFFDFYQMMQEDGMQQQQQQQQQQQPQQAPAQPQGMPQPGAQGTSPPVPPPDPALQQGMQFLSQVKDPKFTQVFQDFQKQLQGIGISPPGQQHPKTSSPPQPSSQPQQPVQ